MSDSDSIYKYPRIDRRQYFLGKVGMIAAVMVVVLIVGPDSPVMRVMGLVLLIATVVMDVLRLQNLGVSRSHHTVSPDKRRRDCPPPRAGGEQHLGYKYAAAT